MQTSAATFSPLAADSDVTYADNFTRFNIKSRVIAQKNVIYLWVMLAALNKISRKTNM